MDIIKKTDFNKVKATKIEEKAPEAISDEKFKELLEQMANPVHAQQQLAVQVKTFLDARIKSEMKEKGFLSDHTRRWVEQFNKILDSIQKSLYGDKSVNLHVHKITHSAIAAKMRNIE